MCVLLRVVRVCVSYVACLCVSYVARVAFLRMNFVSNWHHVSRTSCRNVGIVVCLRFFHARAICVCAPCVVLRAFGFC